MDQPKFHLITAYLFHAGGHDDPSVWLPTAGIVFQGDASLRAWVSLLTTTLIRNATPLSEMRRFIEKDRTKCRKNLPVYRGRGNSSNPCSQLHRYVINFGEMDRSRGQKWPELVAIVENKVKPERLEKAPDVAA